jgi:hypothetical protein
MAIYEHATQFAGKPVVDWDPDQGIRDPLNILYRISLTWEESEGGQSWTDRFAAFLDDAAASRAVGLVVGFWGEDVEPVIEAVAAARDRLPDLKALFLGDIISEENEISWIQQGDVSPILQAYPALEQVRVRGATGLSLGTPRHAALKELTIESGGLGREVVQQVLAGELPALEHLELWLGDSDYGADTTVDDLGPLLFGNLFPRLRYLGLRDSEITDEIAQAVARAPILERIRVLDLSLGTLSDAGASALLAAPAIRKLEKLDLHHHYCSATTIAKLQLLGIEVDVSDPQQADDDDGHRYVAVSE